MVAWTWSWRSTTSVRTSTSSGDNCLLLEDGLLTQHRHFDRDVLGVGEITGDHLATDGGALDDHPLLALLAEQPVERTMVTLTLAELATHARGWLPTGIP